MEKAKETRRQMVENFKAAYTEGRIDWAQGTPDDIKAYFAGCQRKSGGEDPAAAEKRADGPECRL